MIKLLDLQAVTQMHGAEIREAVERVIASGHYLLGQETRLFEQEYAQYIGTRYCVAVANGLDALKLILMGYKELGIMQDGDEIIVPANTYTATILSITESGLKPVLVEPTWEHLELDVDQIENHITPRTKGVMTVHLYGRIAYNEQLADICQRHHLKLMEDCAQSHGCAWQGIRTGALGHAGAHSFYPSKNMGALGDAGAVTTNDEQLAVVIRALANYGCPRKYDFQYAGLNSRMAETDAAVLRVKLKYLDRENDMRRRLANYYYAHISHPLIALPRQLADENNVYHQFPIFSPRRDALQRHLSEYGIQTLVHYPIPPHRQACYKAWPILSLPITERIHREELSIPVNQTLSMTDAQRITEVINAFSGI